MLNSCSRLSVLLFLASLCACECTLYQVYYEGMPTPTRSYTVNLVSDFGGVGDGKTVNTRSFDAAIAHLQSQPDGELVVPAGVFLTAPFNLTSHMTLTVAAGATILAQPNLSSWPVVPPLPSYGQGRDYPGPRRCPFIGGWNLKDVVIRGPGTVDGAGAFWWKRRQSKEEIYTRGRLLELLYTDGVLLEHIHLQNSPFWTVHPVYSSNIVARYLTIDNPTDPKVAPNTDGFDPDSSVNVSLTDSMFSVGDDGVAIKSGWDCFGIETGLPTLNVHIRNLTVNSPCCAGVGIGSEMSGGVANVLAEDLHFINVGQGLRIKAGLGRGGYVMNVTFRNVVMENVINVAVQANDFYGSKNPSCGTRNATALPQVYDIMFSNVTSLGGSGIAADFQGLDLAPIHGVLVESLVLNTSLPLWVCSNVKGLRRGTIEPKPCSNFQEETP